MGREREKSLMGVEMARLNLGSESANSAQSLWMRVTDALSREAGSFRAILASPERDGATGSGKFHLRVPARVTVAEAFSA